MNSDIKIFLVKDEFGSISNGEMFSYNDEDFVKLNPVRIYSEQHKRTIDINAISCKTTKGIHIDDCDIICRKPRSIDTDEGIPLYRIDSGTLFYCDGAAMLMKADCSQITGNNKTCVVSIYNGYTREMDPDTLVYPIHYATVTLQKFKYDEDD